MSGIRFSPSTIFWCSARWPIGSFASGNILVLFGWSAVNEVVFPVVLAAGAMLLWLVLRDRRLAA